MQSSVFAFIVINVDGDVFDETQRPAVRRLQAFKVGGKDVVGFAGGNALGELAEVVGIDFPLGLLVLGAADFHHDPKNGMIVRTPDRAGDESIRLAFGL